MIESGGWIGVGGGATLTPSPGGGAQLCPNAFPPPSPRLSLSLSLPLRLIDVKLWKCNGQQNGWKMKERKKGRKRGRRKWPILSFNYELIESRI